MDELSLVLLGIRLAWSEDRLAWSEDTVLQHNLCMHGTWCGLPMELCPVSCVKWNDVIGG